jgi:hypothetical protein
MNATDVIDAWRCDYCNIYVYNLEVKGGVLGPTHGAPTPKYLSKLYPKVCTLCFDMHNVIKDNDYFMCEQTKWEDAGHTQQPMNAIDRGRIL